MIKNIPCVILSGGKSSRMGEDKALLPFKSSSTLIYYQYERLNKIFSKVYISSKTNKFDFKSNLILDTNNIYSPMVALKSILEEFDDKVFILTVDNPFISKQTIYTLVNNSSNHDITIAKTANKTHSLCGIFSCNLIDNIEDNLKQNIHKIGYLIKNSSTKIIEFKDENEFINLNTKDDYKKALKL